MYIEYIQFIEIYIKNVQKKIAHELYTCTMHILLQLQMCTVRVYTPVNVKFYNFAPPRFSPSTPSLNISSGSNIFGIILTNGSVPMALKITFTNFS